MKQLLALLVALCAALPASAQAQVSFASFSRAEKSYYEKVFAYTMDAVKTDDTYDWATYSGKGRIRVGQAYVSKSGVTCRSFSETLSIGGADGQDSGIGCKRQGADGWCKLRSNNAQTCAMERPADFYNIRMPSVNATVPSVNMNVGGINTPSAPAVNGPNVAVDAPGKGDVSGTGIADSVTGAAGAIAGPTTKKAVTWFGEAFR